MKLYMFRKVPPSIIRSRHDCMTYTIAECTVNKLLMMDGGIFRKMYSFMPK